MEGMGSCRAITMEHPSRCADSNVIGQCSVALDECMQEGGRDILTNQEQDGSRAPISERDEPQAPNLEQDDSQRPPKFDFILAPALPRGAQGLRPYIL